MIPKIIRILSETKKWMAFCSWAIPLTIPMLAILFFNGLGSVCCIAKEMEPQESERETDFLKAVAEGYLANREAFTAFTCRFKIRSGKAQTLEDAVKGVLFETVEGDGTWIVLHPKVLFEIKCDPEVIFKKALSPIQGKRSPVAIPMPAGKYLDNGFEQLYYSPLTAGATIKDRSQRGKFIEWSPFDMGVMGRAEETSPARLIKIFLEGNHFCQLVKSAANQPKGLLGVSLGESPNKVWQTAYLDQDHGYLPKEIWLYESSSTRTNRLSGKVMITDYRNCSHGRWFPGRSIFVFDPDKTQGPYVVREWTTLVLDTDNPPDDNVFSLQLPEGTHVNDNIDPATQFTTGKEERVGLADLTSLVERCKSRAKQYASALAGTEFESSDRRPWFLIIIFSSMGIVAVLLVMKYWLRVRPGRA